MQLGFIGFGEAAFAISCGLKQEGLDTIIAYNYSDGPLVRARAEQAQVELAATPEEVLKRVNVVFVAVPVDKALAASIMLKPHLKAGDLYIDVSASPPEAKKQMWDHIRNRSVAFVDAQMMGPVPMYKHKIPILASGSGTDRLIELMAPYGMDITKVSDNPGDASSIKLIRSIFMKGISVLLIELLETASSLNVDKLVLGTIKETILGSDFEQVVDRLVTGACIHAPRRAIELEGSIEIMKSLHIDSSLTEAVRDKLQMLSTYHMKEQFQDKLPVHWREVISVMEKQGSRGNRI